MWILGLKNMSAVKAQRRRKNQVTEQNFRKKYGVLLLLNISSNKKNRDNLAKVLMETTTTRFSHSFECKTKKPQNWTEKRSICAVRRLCFSSVTEALVSSSLQVAISQIKSFETKSRSLHLEILLKKNALGVLPELMFALSCDDSEKTDYSAWSNANIDSQRTFLGLNACFSLWMSFSLYYSATLTYPEWDKAMWCKCSIQSPRFPISHKTWGAAHCCLNPDLWALEMPLVLTSKSLSKPESQHFFRGISANPSESLFPEKWSSQRRDDCFKVTCKLWLNFEKPMQTLFL